MNNYEKIFFSLLEAVKNYKYLKTWWQLFVIGSGREDTLCDVFMSVSRLQLLMIIDSLQ